MAEKKVNSEKKIVATAGAFDVLRRPIISEKAAKLSECNGVAFEVAAKATKEDVARAVEAIYNVKLSLCSLFLTFVYVFIGEL